MSRQERPRRACRHLGRRTERQSQFERHLEEFARRQQAERRRRQIHRRHRQGLGAGRQGRRRIRTAVPRSRHHGAAELHGSLTPGACEIWTGTQVITRVQSAAAEAAGVPLDKVTVHNHLIGGGFGRRLEPDMVATAVRIARHVDAPLKVLWTREEDVQHDVYRPAYRDVISASLAGGKIVAWKYRVSGSSIMARWAPSIFVNGIDIDAVDSAVDMPYDIPNRRVEYVRAEPPAVPTGFWRGVGPNNNVFATECFMDELARKAGVDPIEFRRGMLGNNPRLKAALDLVAEKSDWGKPLPPRTGAGSARSRLRQFHRHRCRGRSRRRWRRAFAPRHFGGGHRHCGQSRHHRGAIPGRADLRPDGRPLRRNHHRDAAACSSPTSTITACCASIRCRISRCMSSRAPRTRVASAKPAAPRVRRHCAMRSTRRPASRCAGCQSIAPRSRQQSVTVMRERSLLLLPLSSHRCHRCGFVWRILSPGAACVCGRSDGGAY